MVNFSILLTVLILFRSVRRFASLKHTEYKLLRTSKKFVKIFNGMCIYFFERIFGDSYSLCFFYLTRTGIPPLYCHHLGWAMRPPPILSPSGLGDAFFPFLSPSGLTRWSRSTKVANFSTWTLRSSRRVTENRWAILS